MLWETQGVKRRALYSRYNLGRLGRQRTSVCCSGNDADRAQSPSELILYREKDQSYIIPIALSSHVKYTYSVKADRACSGSLWNQHCNIWICSKEIFSSLSLCTTWFPQDPRVWLLQQAGSAVLCVLYQVTCLLLPKCRGKKTGAACSNIPVSKPLNSTSALLHIPHPCRRQTPFKAANIKRAHFLWTYLQVLPLNLPTLCKQLAIFPNSLTLII